MTDLDKALAKIDALEAENERHRAALKEAERCLVIHEGMINQTWVALTVKPLFEGETYTSRRMEREKTYAELTRTSNTLKQVRAALAQENSDVENLS